MEFHVIKRPGHRLLADPAFHHFYALLITHDARFLCAGAHGVDQLGGSPMGMHVDHCSLLGFWSRKSQYTRRYFQLPAIYSNRQTETSVFPQLR